MVHAEARRRCVGCGFRLSGHGKPERCRACSARYNYIKKHGAPAERVIAPCATCRRQFSDYASNRRKGIERFCSVPCRAAWTGVSNSIRRGGDGRKRTKREKDALYYRNPSVAARARARSRERYAANRLAMLVQLQAKDRELKREVIAAYGGRCECCAESRIEFMTIDHADGSGAAHRAKVGKGRGVYDDLKRRGFPRDRYRCLCLNCNISLGFYGYCPHRPDVKRIVDKRPRNPGRLRVVA